MNANARGTPAKFAATPENAVTAVRAPTGHRRRHAGVRHEEAIRPPMTPPTHAHLMLVRTRRSALVQILRMSAIVHGP